MYLAYYYNIFIVWYNSGGIRNIGFVMIGHNSFDFEGCPNIYKHSYYLWRFMIDKEYQGQRYGKDAAKLVLFTSEAVRMALALFRRGGK